MNDNLNLWQTYALPVSEEQFIKDVNQAVAGGKHLGVGHHKVKVAALTPVFAKSGKPYFKVVCADAEGAEIQWSLVPQKSDGSGFTYGYNMLARAKTGVNAATLT